MQTTAAGFMTLSAAQSPISEGGTSNATPEVTGVLALAWAAAPQSSADALLETLQRSSTDLGAPGYDERFGHGVPYAQRAVELMSKQRNP